MAAGAIPPPLFFERRRRKSTSAFRIFAFSICSASAFSGTSETTSSVDHLNQALGARICD
jgi:hypothetical protein